MDATLALPVLVFLIAVALLFDFLNGLHDAANSIATIVSTRVLRPQYAVLWAAFFNFIAFLVFGLHVANTIGTGIIEPSVIDAQVIFGALIGAIVWNLITAMDDAIDQMQQTAKAVVLFEVRSFEPPMREIGTLLVECANLVGRALPLMQSIGDNVAMLTAITEEIGKLEGRIDDLHDIGLKELFLKHRSGNSMDFIVGAEIYKHLEKVSDRFDDVANEINSIVIEQV